MSNFDLENRTKGHCMYAIDLYQIQEFDKKIDEIMQILQINGLEDLSDDLDKVREDLLILNKPLVFSGLNFDVTTDAGEHIGQGSLNADEMRRTELFDMEYWTGIKEEESEEVPTIYATELEALEEVEETV
jgi:hypothetical protein